MSDAALSAAGPPVRRSRPRGSLVGQVFEGLCFAAATTLLLSLGGIIVSLVIGGWPALSKFGIGFLFSATWNPVTDVYGAAGPIVGTLITAALALLISLPIAGGVAFFDWCYKNGDAAAEQLDYVPLPASVKDLIRKSWGKIVGPDGKPVYK